MILTVNIEGKEYYPLHYFAKLVNKSIGSLRYLMFTGNRIRKLKYIEEPVGKYNIPVSEYLEFPFTSTGRFASDKVYHFNEFGEVEYYSEEELQALYTKYNVVIEKRAKLKDIVEEVSKPHFDLEGVR